MYWSCLGAEDQPVLKDQPALKIQLSYFLKRIRDHTQVREGVRNEKSVCQEAVRTDMLSWALPGGSHIFHGISQSNPPLTADSSRQHNCIAVCCAALLMFNSHYLREVLRGFHLPLSTCINIPVQDLSSAADYRQGQIQLLLG